ncbi:MbtH family NRPS accessory protein [Paraburkholderia sp. Ac-20347]|jgi:MbtH protein|uniref:MbtH family protein n=1 Tax=Paraburkholderia sp. Ac-20347 TaxID=2703892 RepID=UPI00197EF35E|nr:MbtH family NRPS accessory protein [Paraburkholderia sp. Ac-20347]MBN3812108.1 MbtH family NRPS accessory protein [Paraburkholderia sp. Ac-20347]
MSWGDENTVFHVVLNHEEQYSIWPAYKPVPEGWRAEGKSGTRDECLAHIETVWTDMRPLSLREAMAAQGAQA